MNLSTSSYFDAFLPFLSGVMSAHLHKTESFSCPLICWMVEWGTCIAFQVHLWSFMFGNKLVAGSLMNVSMSKTSCLWVQVLPTKFFFF